MARFTARQLSQVLGKTAQEVNKALKDAGLLQGEPGNYELTENGERYAEYQDEDNGYGGRAARSWSYRKWDEEVVSKISSGWARGPPDRTCHPRSPQMLVRRYLAVGGLVLGGAI